MSQGRDEIVRRLVLNSVCDDYENIDQVIFPDLAKEGTRLGWLIDRAEVVDALAGLVHDGLVQAYLLSSSSAGATKLPGMPPLITEVETTFKTYFYITPAGMDLYLSDDAWWPFEEEED